MTPHWGAERKRDRSVFVSAARNTTEDGTDLLFREAIEELLVVDDIGVPHWLVQAVERTGRRRRKRAEGQKSVAVLRLLCFDSPASFATHSVDGAM